MIVSYEWRLVCLSLAVFLLIHTALGLLVALIATPVARLAERIRPRVAARLLLALRLGPCAAAIFVVAAFCIPSYLWLEPEANAEEVSWLCLAAAVAAAAIWAGALFKSVRALFRSSRYAHNCERTDAPVLMLVGVFRPRVVVSRAVLEVLAPDQLNAALRHEQAHQRAGDNFKRLLLAATPAWGLAGLERAWGRMSEWAADDESVAGDCLRCLSLASALVAVARLGCPRQNPSAASFCGDSDDLARRVDRLLHPRTFAPAPLRLLSAAGAAALASLVVLTLQPSTLEAAHRLFEHLVH